MPAGRARRSTPARAARRGRLTLAACATLLALLGAPGAAHAVAGWALTGTMTTARVGHTSTLLANGKVLVAGGGATATTEIYDPATGTWTPAAPMGTGRQYHTATLLGDGRVLVAGGSTGSVGATAELYDPIADTWAPTDSMAAVRAGHTATLLANGKVLVAGDASTDTAITELYDPATGTWSTPDPMAATRRNPTATLLASGKVLVAGGCCAGALSSAETYDPATAKWSPVGGLTTGRHRHLATLLADGNVLVHGGETTTAETFDPATNVWSATGSMSTDRYVAGSIRLTSGKVLAMGGYVGTSPVASAELYDPATGTWSSAADMVVPRYFVGPVLLASGKILLAGGASTSGPTATAELYTPKSAPSLATTASGAIELGASVSATAQLEGEDNPTSGDVVFELYGPGDASCGGAPLTSTVPIALDGTATSGALTPPAAGTYRWIARYAGDASNEATASGCGDAGTTVVVMDTTAPDTTIDTGPTGLTNDPTPTFTFHADTADSTFECRFDAALFAACGSTSTFTPAVNLLDGEHTFAVRATDPAANTDQSPATRSFTVDTVAPDTTIDTGPAGLTGVAAATFSFSSSEPASTFECRIDDGAYTLCTTPFASAMLSDGAHRFSVRATDPAANTDATPAIRSFTVDTTAPDTTISAGPVETTLLRRPAFAFASNEPAATFTCSIDSEPFVACSSPLATRELAFGQHTFRVRATDAVGLSDLTPALRAFTVKLAQHGCPIVTTQRIGTSRPDSIDGLNLASDVIFGLARNDVLRGHGGRDCLYGAGGNDRLYGGRGLDRVFGEQGNDKLYGERRAGDRLGGAEAREGEGGDHLDGGPGDDQLTDHRGSATLRGGSGADRIDARDDSARDRRTPDAIRCGSGQDTVRADASDEIADDCEHITRQPPPRGA